MWKVRKVLGIRIRGRSWRKVRSAIKHRFNKIPKVFPVVALFLIYVLYFLLKQREKEWWAENKDPKLLEIIKAPRDTYPESLFNPSSLPVLLFWVHPFGRKDPLTVMEEFTEREYLCKHRCRFTANRDYYYDEASAIVFHGSSLASQHSRDLPPEPRDPNQIWIYYNEESPINLEPGDARLLRRLGPVFNWTMTYRRDSDIYHPYGLVERRSTNDTLEAAEDENDEKWRARDPSWRERHSNRTNRSLLASLDHLPALNKTKLAVWSVSHCNTKSRREELVKELQKYVPIDIVGTCGDQMKCRKDGWNFAVCLPAFEMEYKFILAFENSLCGQYITEKFFNALEYDIVPVVYSGGDYGALGAPKCSYIDVRDFKSPKELAEHLLYLDKNDEAYKSYLKCKEGYRVVPKHKRPWCEICKRLHAQRNRTGTGEQRQWYSDILAWFTGINEESNSTRSSQPTPTCAKKRDIHINSFTIDSIHKPKKMKYKYFENRFIE